MGFFTGKPETEADDPVFGTIRFDRRRERWKGRMGVPGLAGDVTLTVEADDAGPSDRQRRIAARLAEEFRQLLPDRQAAVLEHYRRVREAWREDVQLAEVLDAEQLWSSLKLRELQITRDRKHFWPELELMLHFDAPWVEEHGLQLAIGDNKLLEVRDE